MSLPFKILILFLMLSSPLYAQYGIKDLKVLPHRWDPIPLPGQELEMAQFEDPLVESIMNPVVHKLKRGESIRILQSNGERITSLVRAINEDSLSLSNRKTIAFEDIVFLERQVDPKGNQWAKYPTPDATTPLDETLNCEQVARELRFIDVLRRANNEDIVRLEDHGRKGSKHRKDIMETYLEPKYKTRDANQSRMITLLHLWLKRSCSDEAIHFDSEMAEQLAAVKVGSNEEGTQTDTKSTQEILDQIFTYEK